MNNWCFKAMAMKWLLSALVLLTVRCTMETDECSQVEVIWPKNTTTPLSVCGLEVRLPLREAVVISLHLSGFVSNSTGPAPVLVEIGFAGDDTVIHEELAQEVITSLSLSPPVVTEEVWLHFSVPVCFQLTIRGCLTKGARVAVTAPHYPSELHHSSLRLARALASRNRRGPEHSTPRPYSWLNLVVGGGATVLVLLVLPLLILLLLCCNETKRRDHKKLVSHTPPDHGSPFHPSPFHKSAFCDKLPDSKSEFSYTLEFQDKEHPLGSPTTSTFGVLRCDSLGVVRSSSVFTSPLLGSPARQPLLQDSPLHSPPGNSRAKEKEKEALEDLDQSYSTSTMVIVGGVISTVGGAPQSPGETPQPLSLEPKAPLHPVSPVDQPSPRHTSGEQDSTDIRVSSQPDIWGSPRHQPCHSPDNAVGPATVDETTCNEPLTTVDGASPQPNEVAQAPTQVAGSAEELVYVHLHKCSPTTAAPEGVGPVVAAPEGVGPVVEAMGKAEDAVVDGIGKPLESSLVEGDKETSLDRGVRGSDGMVSMVLRKPAKSRPKSAPHPYHTLEVPAPPASSDTSAPEEGGVEEYPMCHTCGQVIQQPPVGKHGEPVYLELLSGEQSRVEQLQEGVGLAPEVRGEGDVEQEPEEFEHKPAPTYHVLERQQLILCQDCQAGHSQSFYHQLEAEGDGTPPPIPPRDVPPRQHTDPVYERVGSLNHRHQPLKQEVSNSSHTYTSLKSEEGSCIMSAKPRGLQLKQGSSSDYESVPSFKEDSSSPYYHKAADIQEIVDMFRERMKGEPHPLPVRPLPLRPPPLVHATNGESIDSHDYESLPNSFDHGFPRKENPEHNYASIGPTPAPDDLSPTSPPFVPEGARRATLLKIDSEGYASIVQRGDSQERHKYTTMTVNNAEEVWRYQQENHYAPLTLPRRKKSRPSRPSLSSLAYRLSKSSDPLPLPEGFNRTVPCDYEVPVVHHPVAHSPEAPVVCRSPSASPRLERQKAVMSEAERVSQDGQPLPSAVHGDGGVAGTWEGFADDVFDTQSMSSNKDPGLTPDHHSSNTEPGLTPDHHSSNTEPGLIHDHHSSNTEPGLIHDHHSSNTEPGLIHDHHSSNTEPGFTPDHHSSNTEPGLTPDHRSSNTEPGFTPDHRSSNTEPGLTPDHRSSNTEPGLTPDHRSSNTEPGLTPDHRSSTGLGDQSLASISERSCSECSEGPPVDRPRAMTFAGIQLEPDLDSMKAARQRQSLHICLNQQSRIVV